MRRPKARPRTSQAPPPRLCLRYASVSRSLLPAGLFCLYTRSLLALVRTKVFGIKGLAVLLSHPSPGRCGNKPCTYIFHISFFFLLVCVYIDIHTYITVHIHTHGSTPTTPPTHHPLLLRAAEGGTAQVGAVATYFPPASPVSEVCQCQ